jgi:hypothetical protein
MTTSEDHKKPTQNYDYKGGDLDQSFKEFFRLETNRIMRQLRKYGCTKFEFHCNFNYFSGFFTTKNGTMYYVSCSDIRHFGYSQLLYRTVKHYKDYTGGSNCYTSTERGKLFLGDYFKRLFAQ